MYHYVSQLCNYREDIFLGVMWGVLVTCPILEHMISRVRGGTANQAVNAKYLESGVLLLMKRQARQYNNRYRRAST